MFSRARLKRIDRDLFGLVSRSPTHEAGETFSGVVAKLASLLMFTPMFADDHTFLKEGAHALDYAHTSRSSVKRACTVNNQHRVLWFGWPPLSAVQGNIRKTRFADMKSVPVNRFASPKFALLCLYRRPMNGE